MKKEIYDNLLMIDACTGTIATSEQREFEADFTTPLYSFSNPGTGKSHSIVKGIINAQTIHRIPGRLINAMSFTREATAELKVRYDKACKACDMTPTAKFNTFHSICRSIILEKYPSMKTKSGYDWDSDLEVLKKYMKDEGLECDDFFYVKKVLQTIENLDHTLIYDKEHVRESFRFKELDMDVGSFQRLRKRMFVNGLVRNNITQGDIPNYALYVLLNNPEIREKYKAQYKIMIVDEFQDMTKLYLVVLSLISENLIVIGDMKQQIYGFNGACSEIVEEYKKLYPNARRVDLTQSFRCKNEIADYATRVYYPNDLGIEAFKGTEDGGSVRIIPSNELPLEDIVSKIKEDRRDSMFLFRNNFSMTPIAEELYKQGVPFRVKKFYKIMDLPIFKEMTDMAYIAMDPTNIEYVKALTWIMPEMRKYNVTDCPLVKAMEMTNAQNKAQGIRNQVSVFDVPYDWQEDSSKSILSAIKIAGERIKEGKICLSIFEAFDSIYDKYIIEGKWWKLEQKKEYYYEIAAPILTKKTFQQMVNEEYDKQRKIDDAESVRMGVKCYTMHSAKGLEAEDVYIIDAEDVLFPSEKNMKRYIKYECDYEAAKVLREERNLLYVAITRAKSNVVITYRDKLTELITSPLDNKYSFLDDVYASYDREFRDVETFMSLLNLDSKMEETSIGQTYITTEDDLADCFAEV